MNRKQRLFGALIGCVTSMATWAILKYFVFRGHYVCALVSIIAGFATVSWLIWKFEPK